MAEIAPWDEARRGSSAAPSPSASAMPPWEEARQKLPPATSAGGLAGSITRGLAPMAAGAGMGAALGVPFGGVGAIPGAAAGAGAVGLSELATSLYNRVAGAAGWPKTGTPQEMTDRLLDFFGEKRPSTGIERIAEAVSGGAANALGPAKAAGAVADAASGPIAKGIAGKLAEKPGMQAAAGAAGGLTGQAAAEAGLPPLAQDIASLAGSAAVPGGLKSPELLPAVQKARDAGYVLTPSMISEKPGIVSTLLAGWGGRVKTQQAASARNQEVTNNLAAQALGLPKDTYLSDQTFKDVRAVAAQDYRAVANAVPRINADPTYDAIVANLGGQNSQLAQLFPKLMGNKGISDLSDELRNVSGLSPNEALDLVRDLRFKANANMARRGPSKQALGIAQRQAADAVDDLMERNIAATGQSDLVNNYREARRQIARSYDIEAATNAANGDVNSRVLARLKVKGRPLTGELDTIADAALAFPKVTQPPAAFGREEPLSVIDVTGAGISAATGHPMLALEFLGRPLARAGLMSQPYQQAMTTMPGLASPPPLPLMMNPGAQGVVDPSNAARRLGRGALLPTPAQP